MTDRVNFDRIALNYNRVADTYEAGRPQYQDHIVDRVLELADLRPGDVILDLAAGTGKFTRCLTATGSSVIAAEPVRAMATQLREVLPVVPTVRAYAGRLPLADASLAAITVAQAFQWFDQSDMPELGRVVRPGGLLALVWNRRQDSMVWERIAPIIDAFRPGPRRGVDAPTMIQRSGLFDAAVTERWPWVRTVTRAQLHDHVQSLSWVAALDDAQRSHITREIDAGIGSGATFELDYVSKLVFARRI